MGEWEEKCNFSALAMDLIWCLENILKCPSQVVVNLVLLVQILSPCHYVINMVSKYIRTQWNIPHMPVSLLELVVMFPIFDSKRNYISSRWSKVESVKLWHAAPSVAWNIMVIIDLILDIHSIEHFVCSNPFSGHVLCWIFLQCVQYSMMVHTTYILLSNTISYPMFADADTGIYPHAASQYHVPSPC